MIKLILSLLLLFASSCVTLEKCQERYGECGRIQTITVKEYRDTTLYLKGENITDTLEICDVEYIHWKDSTGRLTAEIGRITNTKNHYIRITSKPDTIVLTKVLERITEGKTKYVNRDKIPLIYWIALFGSLLFGAFLFVRSLRS